MHIVPLKLRRPDCVNLFKKVAQPYVRSGEGSFLLRVASFLLRVAILVWMRACTLNA